MTTLKEDIIQSMVLALVSVILGFGFIFLLVQLAPASPVCMTKREARIIWPTQHIYWHGPNRCWDNKRHRPRGYYALAEDRKDKKKADKLVSAPLDSSKPMIIEQDFCCWPDLAQLELEARREHYKRLKGWLEYKP